MRIQFINSIREHHMQADCVLDILLKLALSTLRCVVKWFSKLNSNILRCWWHHPIACSRMLKNSFCFSCSVRWSDVNEEIHLAENLSYWRMRLRASNLLSTRCLWMTFNWICWNNDKSKSLCYWIKSFLDTFFFVLFDEILLCAHNRLHIVPVAIEIVTKTIQYVDLIFCLEKL